MITTHLAVGLFVLLMVLIFLRMPIAIAMLVCGALGFGLIAGWKPLLGLLTEVPYSEVANHELTVIPLFVLMGQLAAEGGISQVLYRSALAWVGHRRGGIAMATIGGCAAFGAICGSSVATGATMASIALPEMRRCGYSGALATGALAAGGTLGILIPPSIVLVIYAILAEQPLGQLFLAAVIPGIIATFGYGVTIWAYTRIAPSAGPAVARAHWGERLRSLKAVWPVLVIFLVVIGGIYRGVFTPTEGAAVGAAMTGILSWTIGGMRFSGLRAAILGTARITGMIFLILIGASFYSSFLALSQAPQQLAKWVVGSGWPPLGILAGIVVIYLMLGCMMDGLAMMLVTVPVFLPLILRLNFGMSHNAVAVWFGILVLILIEVGQITPPIGLNVFVINTMAGDVPMKESFKGVIPFFLSDLVRIAIVIFVPITTTWLAGLS